MPDLFRFFKPFYSYCVPTALPADLYREELSCSRTVLGLNRESRVREPPWTEGISQKKFRETKTKNVTGIYFAAEQIALQNHFSNVSPPKETEPTKRTAGKPLTAVPPPPSYP